MKRDDLKMGGCKTAVVLMVALTGCDEAPKQGAKPALDHTLDLEVAQRAREHYYMVSHRQPTPTWAVLCDEATLVAEAYASTSDTDSNRLWSGMADDNCRSARTSGESAEPMIKRYEFLVRNHASAMDLCTESAAIAMEFSRLLNDYKFREWNTKKQRDCARAGE